jgi:hypothetical protein
MHQKMFGIHILQLSSIITSDSIERRLWLKSEEITFSANKNNCIKGAKSMTMYI